MSTEKKTNNLISETSPYLLQHAHNPVNWHAWNDETLNLAKQENKLLLISIGYSSCHWCHVMEEESFENEEVANIMNQYFINVKVDREERPDIDQIYMNAVQLMAGQGGWPLNCIALPDGRPVWGGTYFKKEEWAKTLFQIGNLYISKPETVLEYAEKLTLGIQESSIVNVNTEEVEFTNSYLKDTVKKWSIYFDDELGGLNRAPKFPMPNNYHFLLRHAYQNNDKELIKYVNNTLTKIALGGIFDQINGGFSRYSVDTKWHIPHFEKMLYDNGQLVSLYADAYLITKNALYKETIINTMQFIERELLDISGGFYSAIDADSLDENNTLEEGAYYVWTKPELEKILTDDFELFSSYYNINTFGFWEHNKYHLIRNLTDDAFSKEHQIPKKQLKEKVRFWQNTLLKERKKKKYPRLDDKILTSWNGIMLKGYIDAYRVLNNHHYLEIALTNANFIEQHLIKEDATLYHNYKNGKSTINGYLEDYGTIIDAFIALYEVTFNEKWLTIANNLTAICFDYFYNQESKMFYFTSEKDTKLIARKTEIEDNVMPSSNSMMAKNLYKLGHFYSNAYYLKTSKQMLKNMIPMMGNYGSAYSNWLDLYSNFSQDYYEIAICGEEARERLLEINQKYIPNKLLCGSLTNSELPLLLDRFNKNKTLVYVCVNNTCQLPTEKTNEALKLIKT
ncbi:MAG: thioredoxin domain-containing protein [Flavobacteriaceae bacterium]|nr:thioredoxin domain-containing protein [Flavobacteriaceae bacterium]